VLGNPLPVIYGQPRLSIRHINGIVQPSYPAHYEKNAGMPKANILGMLEMTSIFNIAEKL